MGGWQGIDLLEPGGWRYRGLPWAVEFSRRGDSFSGLAGVREWRIRVTQAVGFNKLTVTDDSILEVAGKI